uniref:rRNA biogenesis protein RRP36 n=1 Tax=Cannabis sativa TaxID=3483 RepID=A0A803PKK4_CANSA
MEGAIMDNIGYSKDFEDDDELCYASLPVSKLQPRSTVDPPLSPQVDRRSFFSKPRAQLPFLPVGALVTTASPPPPPEATQPENSRNSKNLFGSPASLTAPTQAPISQGFPFLCNCDLGKFVLIEMKNPNNQFSKLKKVEFPDSEEDIGSPLSSSSSEHEEEEEIERELADVTFEELQKARSNGSHSVSRKDNKEKKVGRANKNRPMEVSCKKPVGRFRDVVQAPKKVLRDPRFESLCGTLDNDGFKKRYNFLFEEELPAEKEELRKQLKKSSDPEVVEELKNQLSWILMSENNDSLKNMNSFRDLASLKPILRKEGKRMLQRINDTCLIASLWRISNNKVNELISSLNVAYKSSIFYVMVVETFPALRLRLPQCLEVVQASADSI